MRVVSNLCIFYPCTLSEYYSGNLTKSLKKFSNSNPSKSFSFDIFLFFNKNSSEEFIDIENFKSSEFINSINIHFLNFKVHEDLYISNVKSKQDLNFHIPIYGLSSGPNLSFFNSLYYLLSNKKKYDHFLLLESDVSFISPHWLDRIIDFCNKNKFIIAGSKYKGFNKFHHTSQYKDHINGVALYKNSFHLYNLLKNCEEYILHQVSKNISFINFDIAINEWVNSDIGKKIMKKHPNIINVDFITNASDPSDRHKSIDEILDLHPNTLILHKKD